MTVSVRTRRTSGFALFSQAGRYNRFLRRMLAITAGPGLACMGLLVWDAVSLRVSRTTPVLGMLFALTIALALASSLLALLAHCHDRRSVGREEPIRAKRILDSLWHTAAVGTLVSFIGLQVTSIAFAEPMDFHVQYFSSQNPLQFLSIAVLVLSGAVLSVKACLAFLAAFSALLAILAVSEAGTLTLASIGGSAYFLCFNAAHFLAIVWLLARADELDATRDALASETLAVHSTHAANEAQRQVNSFIHDHILSALIPVASGVYDRALLRATAQQALDSLNGRTADDRWEHAADEPATHTDTGAAARADLPAPLSSGQALESTPARVLGLLTTLTLALLLATHWHHYSNPAIPTAGLLVGAGCGYLLLRTWPGARLPFWVATLVPLATGVVNLAVLFTIPAHSWPENEAWSLGMGTMLSWALAMRAQLVAAWLSMALTTLCIAIWVQAAGLPSLLILTIAFSYVLSLVAWSLLLVAARWALVTIHRDEQRITDLEFQRVDDRLAAEVIELTLDRVDQGVRPLLELIASSAPLDAGTQRQAALAEAELRDEIRGGQYFAAIRPEVRDARERGVTVMLMDDSRARQLTPELLRVVHHHAREVLRGTRDGRVVIRLVPPRPHQEIAATISAPGTSLDINLDGTVLDMTIGTGQYEQ
ncbi:hypothetical protein VR010_02135 [Actinomycetaceae bacterium L2_0104]